MSENKNITETEQDPKKTAPSAAESPTKKAEEKTADKIEKSTDTEAKKTADNKAKIEALKKGLIQTGDSTGKFMLTHISLILHILFFAGVFIFFAVLPRSR